MSNERDKTPVSADESVARAYRECADERVPGHLDRAVLDKAARAIRPGYARSRAWTRPLAWAATIVLSVAIVLELTRVPAPEDAGFETAAPVEGRAADPIQGAREKSRPTQKTSTSSPVEALSVRPARMEADAPLSPPESESRADFADVRESADMAINEVSRQQANEAMEELADDELGRLAPSPAPATLGIGAETAVSEPRRCPPEATEQPSTWLECIEDLERAGLVDEAAEERQRLREAFPGIELR